MKERFTLDMSPEDKKHLKIISTELGETMSEFLLLAMAKRIEEVEESLSVQRAYQTLEGIKKGEIKTISWEEMKERIDE